VLKGPYAKLIYNAEYGVIAITTKRGGGTN